MTSPDAKYWTSDRIMRLIIGVVVGGALLWLMYYLRDALLPFFVAVLAAYILQPLVDFNQRIMRVKNRVAPSVLAVVQVALVVGAVLWISVPSVVRELNELNDIIVAVSKGKLKPPPSLAPVFTFLDRFLNPATLSKEISNFRIEELVNKSTSLLEGSLDVLFKSLQWLLTLIYLLFILIDYERIVRGLKMIVPLKYRGQVLAVVNDVKVGMNHYFRGQGVVALCAMVLYSVGFAIIGLPLAIPMGILVGVLYMIPYFQYVTVIPVAVICLAYSLDGNIDFWSELGKCALVYVVSQCICDYLITPHVMGKELGLNPAVILLSLSVWGTLFGIIGMIIALPVTAFLMSYYERYISNRT